METIKTNAVPLRSVKHSESSRIITFYTEAEGQIAVIAKGVRKAKHLVPADTYSLMNIVYRSKSTREVQLMISLELLDGFINIRNDLDKSAAAFGICELVLRTTAAQDPNPLLFEVLVNTLKGLDSAGARLRNYYWYFQLGLIKSLGFGFQAETCADCGKNAADFKGNKYPISFEYGGAVCEKCASSETIRFTLRPETLKVLQFLSMKDLEKVGRLRPSIQADGELEGLFSAYLRYHIEGLKTLKSKELIYRK